MVNEVDSFVVREDGSRRRNDITFAVRWIRQASDVLVINIEIIVCVEMSRLIGPVDFWLPFLESFTE